MLRFVFLALLLAQPVFAQQTEPARCEDVDTYSVLDFWIGQWDVFAGDKLAGTNHIKRILGGCAVLEHWSGSGGGEGKSLFYVTADGIWKQVWVTEWATRPGGIKEKTRQQMKSADQVRFQGTIVVPDGKNYLDRTTLTKQANGEVRQLIEVSIDGGTTWKSMFDAIYRRRQD